MAPRSYQLGKRAVEAQATRERILDAIVALHAEKGVAATTVADIAARADVAIGTVTRYFGSLDEMVGACGGRLMELFPLPDADIFDGRTALADRIRAFLG